MENAKVILGNPVNEKVVVPDAPAPSHVGTQPPEQRPNPTAREDSPEEEIKEDVVSPEDLVLDGEMDKGVDVELQKKLDAEVDAQPKGTITIQIFENSPYEIDFTGVVTGTEIDMAWRFMMKEYRVWKHKMFKRIEADKKDGGV